MDFEIIWVFWISVLFHPSQEIRSKGFTIMINTLVKSSLKALNWFKFLKQILLGVSLLSSYHYMLYTRHTQCVDLKNVFGHKTSVLSLHANSVEPIQFQVSATPNPYFSVESSWQNKILCISNLDHVQSVNSTTYIS